MENKTVFEIREISGYWYLGYENMEVIIKPYKTRSGAEKAAKRMLGCYKNGGVVICGNETIYTA